MGTHAGKRQTNDGDGAPAKVKCKASFCGLFCFHLARLHHHHTLSTQEERESPSSPRTSARPRFRSFSFLPAGIYPYGSGRLATNLLRLYSRPPIPPLPIPDLTSIRRHTPLSIPFSPGFSLCITNTSCLALQKVVRPCFLVLNSQQISCGQPSSMRIWNSLE